MKEALVVVLGPTAVGKTDLAVELALRWHGEVVSGDSMLVYRGLDIGTAKPSLAERRGVPHHLIDILEPAQPYDAVRFGEQAAAVIRDIWSRGRLPVLAGGTGLYLQAFLEDYAFSEVPEDASFRRAMEELARREGNEAVHRLLQERDATSAVRLHPNNLRRVIRALEIARAGAAGAPAAQQEKHSFWLDRALVLGLTLERQELYRRIEARVACMLQSGLEQEVRQLLADGLSPRAQSMQGIGYKEIAAWLLGQSTREQAVAELCRNTRRFAKRQFTWFRRMPYIHWLDVAMPHWREEAFSLVAQHLETGSDLPKAN